MHITKYQTNTEEDVEYSKSYGLKGIAESTITTSCVHQSEILGIAAKSSFSSTSSKAYRSQDTNLNSRT
jgi:hypothetical protein